MTEKTCNLEAIEALARDELDDESAAQLRRHLEACGDCANELAWLEVETQMMRSRARAGAPLRMDYLWKGVAARIGGQKRRERHWFSFGIAGLTAAVVTAAILLFISRDVRPPQSAQEVEHVPAAAKVAASRSKDSEDSLAAALAAVEEAEASELAAIAALEGLYQQGRAQLDARTTRAIDAEIALYRETVAKANTGVGDDLPSQLHLLNAQSKHRQAVQAVVYRLEEIKP
jgi:hypothetical protein